MRIAMVLLIGLGGGCCTHVGCVGSIVVEIDGDLVGDVEVAFDTTEPATCTFAAEAADPIVCEDFQIEHLDGVWKLTRQLPMGEPPAEVTVRVTDDSGAVLDETFAPDYGDEYFPNGRACDGEGCFGAVEAFSLRG